MPIQSLGRIMKQKTKMEMVDKKQFNNLLKSELDQPQYAPPKPKLKNID